MTNKNMVLCIYLIMGFLLYSALSKVFERCMLNHLMFYILFMMSLHLTSMVLDEEKILLSL